MANCSVSQLNLQDRNVSENVQSEVQMSTFVPPTDLPPPYTVIDVAPTHVPPEMFLSQPVINQVVQPTILVPGVLKKDPVFIHCPSCHQTTITTVQFVNSQKTHMLAGFICGLTLCCMLCCLSIIPYIIPTCKNVDHYCSRCNYFIGSYYNSK